MAKKSPLCTHMEGLAKAWARFPSVNVIEGDFEIDCYLCNVKANVSQVFTAVNEYEKELALGGGK